MFEPGEQVEQDINLLISGKPAVRLVLTNRAAYWPGSKFAVSDGVTTERAAHAQVLSVATGTRSQFGSLVVGVLMVVGGAVWTLGGFVGAPQALIVGGIIVAFVGGRRRTIRINAQRAKFSWNEPIAFGGGVKEQVSHVIDAVHSWARGNGLRLEE